MPSSFPLTEGEQVRAHSKDPTLSAPNAAGLALDARRERWIMLGLTAPALSLVTIIMIAPIVWLFSLSLLADDGTFSLEHYRRLLEQPSYRRNFIVTFEISLLTTAIAIALGYPLAYVLAQLPRRAASLCLIAVLLPFWTSLLVRTYAWLVLLQRQGLINKWGIAHGWWSEPLTLVHNFSGTLIGTVHIMLPFLILPVYGTMKSIDGSLMNAAANLGASPARAFWSVYFPLSLPGLMAGALIVFILSLGFYVTPAVLGGGKVSMVSNRIANDIEIFFNWGAASALGVVLLTLTLIVVYAAARLLGLSRIAGAGHAP